MLDANMRRELLGLIDERDKQIKELISIVEGLEQKLSEQDEQHKGAAGTLEEANLRIDEQRVALNQAKTQNQTLAAENAELQSAVKERDAALLELDHKFKAHEEEMRAELEDRERHHQSEVQVRDRETKEGSQRLREELDKSYQQFALDAEKVRHPHDNPG